VLKVSLGELLHNGRANDVQIEELPSFGQEGSVVGCRPSDPFGRS
jgi:hypothetical protein